MGLMKKMASVLVTASLLFGLVGTAFAQSPEEIQAGAARMQQLGIVNGDQTGDLKLGDPITRAQLMKIMVWAFGQKDNAQILKGANAFPDTATHWASGEIAIAKNIIVEKNHFEMGMPDGTFAPEGKVTAAQAVAFLMKFLGISPDAAKTWPNNYLDAAVSSGMISAEVRDSIAATANTEATRGLVFFLADTAFAGYPVSTGKTVYTTYVKPAAPVLTVEASTLTTTASKVTITGTVSADAKSVYVGTTSNSVSVSNGSFSFDYDLSMGANDIVVGATDIVGATSTKTLTVTRTVGTAAKINVASSVSAKAGETVDVAAAVEDASGNAISDAALTIEGEGFAYADGKLTVPTKAGNYTVSFKYADLKGDVAVTVNPADAAKILVTPSTVSLSLGAAQKFAAQVTDQYDNAIDGSSVTWAAVGGIVDASGNFAATAAGTATVTATAGSLSGTATVSVFGVPTALKLSTPANIVGNYYDATEFTVSVVDANGNVVETAENTITVRTSNSTDFVLGDDGTAAVTVKAVKGVATVALSSNSALRVDKTAVLTASSEGLTGANVTAKAVKQVLTNIKISADPTTIGADNGSQTNLRFMQYDQQGKPMDASYDSTINLSISTSDSTMGSLAETSFTFGNYYKDVLYTSSVKTGSVTINGVVTTVGKTSIPVESTTIAISPVYYPTQLSVDAIKDVKSYNSTSPSTAWKQAVTVRVKDLNGNQVSNSAANSATSLTLRVDSPKATDIQILKSDKTTSATTGAVDTTSVKTVISDEVINPTRGKYTFYVTAKKAVTLTYTVTGTWDSTPDVTLASATGTGNILAGDANQISLYPSHSNMDGTAMYLPADGVTAGTVTIKVADVNSNPVSGTYSLKVKKVAGGTTATKSFSDLVVSTVDGVASFQVTASTNNGGSDSYQVIDNDDSVTLSANSITVYSDIIGVPHELDMAVDTLTAGKTGYAYVEIEDDNDKVVVTDNSTSVHLVVRYDDQYGDIAFEGDAVVENGIATFPLNLTDTNYGGVYYAKATSGSLIAATNDSVTVAAGPASKLGILQYTSSMSMAADDTSRADLLVYLTDEFGNDAAGTDTVTIKLDSSTYVKFRDTVVSGYTRVSATEARFAIDADGNQRFNDVLGAQPYIGSAVMNATSAANYAATSATVNVIGTLAPAKMAISVKADVTAGSNQTVYIYLQDVNGNRVTTSNGDDGVISFTTTKPDGTTSSQTVTGTANFYKGRYTVLVATDKAGTWSYSATGTYASATNLGLSTAVGTVNPGVAGAVVIDAQPSALVANGSDTVTFTVRVVDGLTNKNTVGSYNGKFDFRILSGNDYVELLNTTADINGGVGYVTVRAKNVAGSATLQARVNGVTGALNGWVGQSVTVGAGDASTISVWTNLPALLATNFASTTAVEFMVRDSSGNPIPGVNVTPLVTSSTSTATHFVITPSVETATDSNGILRVYVAPATGGNAPVAGDKFVISGTATIGGTATTASSREVLISNAPSVGITTSDSTTNDNTQTITGTSNGADTVVLSGAGLTASVNATVTPATGAWTADVTLSAGQGAKAITATATNTNGQTATDTMTFTFDDVAPVLTNAGGSVTTNSTAVTMTGTTEAGATVAISGTGLTASVDATVTGTAWTADVTLTGTDGAKPYTITATDAAGNTTVLSGGHVLDTTAPSAVVSGFVAGATSFTITFDGPVQQTTLTAANFSLTGVTITNITKSGYVVTVYVDALASGDAVANATGANAISDAAGNAVTITTPLIP